MLSIWCIFMLTFTATQNKCSSFDGVFCIPLICWNFIFCNVATSNNFKYWVQFSILSHDNNVKMMWPCLGTKNTSPFGLKYLFHGWKCQKLLCTKPDFVTTNKADCKITSTMWQRTWLNIFLRSPPENIQQCHTYTFWNLRSPTWQHSRL